MAQEWTTAICRSFQESRIPSPRFLSQETHHGPIHGRPEGSPAGWQPACTPLYAATQPAAKNALAGVAYSSTEISLSRPVTTGTFVIQSDPSRGEVTINGKYFGNTPLTHDMAPGTYQITVSLEGYVPASGMYTIDAGETKRSQRNWSPGLPLRPLPLFR